MKYFSFFLIVCTGVQISDGAQTLKYNEIIIYINEKLLISYKQDACSGVYPPAITKYRRRTLIPAKPTCNYSTWEHFHSAWSDLSFSSESLPSEPARLSMLTHGMFH